VKDGTGIAGGDAILRRLDRRPIPDVEDEIRAFMVVRNEVDLLPASLAHHRALGVGRFFVIDNGSVDGTVDYLLSETDVHVFSTTASYQLARNGIDWIEALLHAHGVGRWCLVLDGDEYLVYPGFESGGLPKLCHELSGRGLNCLPTVFIDLYRARPIARSTACRPFSRWSRCFFDNAGYYNLPPTGSCLPRVFGGPRARVFWPEIDLRSYGVLARGYVEQAFDEPAYLNLHGDVKDAVSAGVMKSGLEHFNRYGHAELRTVHVVHVPGWPEEVYLRRYPDVKHSIAAGVFASGLEHYVRFGQFEGRLLWRSGPPCLSQVPLIRWEPGMSLDVGRHQLRGARWTYSDACGGALLHLRLTRRMAQRASLVAADTVKEPATPWEIENLRYSEMLQRNPKLSAMGPPSVRFRNATQLVTLGILTAL
jgi:hypothetical protein